MYNINTVSAVRSCLGAGSSIGTLFGDLDDRRLLSQADCIIQNPEIHTTCVVYIHMHPPDNVKRFKGLLCPLKTLTLTASFRKCEVQTHASFGQ